MNGERWFHLPDRPTLLTVLGWSLLIDALFFPVYGGINWLTSQRHDLLDLYLPAEFAIPLVPEAVWIYLSMFLLFCLPLFTLPRERAPREAMAAILGLCTAAAVWLLFPARLGFERVLPAGYESVYGMIFSLDAPHNLVPSLHVVFSTIAVLACSHNAPRMVRVGLWIWLMCIVASTLLAHQHHVLDVVTGLLVAFVCREIALRWAMRPSVSFMPLLVKENKG
jgi:membrane-associated phospholipid phosphatase